MSKIRADLREALAAGGDQLKDFIAEVEAKALPPLY